MSRSSSEAEYRSMAAMTCEIQWLHYLLLDLQVPFVSLSLVYCDNQVALHIIANPCSMKELST